MTGVPLMLVAVAESLAVLWLAVGTSRHLAWAQPPARG